MSTAKVIAKEGLYVRADRTRKSDVVRTMAYGEEFDFIEEYKGWLAVEDGWVRLSDAWVKPVEMTGSADLPFGEEIVNDKEVVFSYVTDVDVLPDNTSSVKITCDGDLPTYALIPVDAYVTVEYKSPTNSKVFTLNKFANYYGTIQATSTDTSVNVTWVKSNGVYTISVFALYTYFGYDHDATITVTMQVDHITHNITTIDPKFLPEANQFGEKINEIELYHKTENSFNPGGITWLSTEENVLKDCSIGDTIKFVINDDEYITTIYADESGNKCLGDSSFDNEPFFFQPGSAGKITLDTSVYAALTSHFISIYKLETVVTTIDPKFLPMAIIDTSTDDANKTTFNRTFEEVCWSIIDHTPFMTFVRDNYGFTIINNYCFLSEQGAPLANVESPSEVYAIGFYHYHEDETTIPYWLMSDNTFTTTEPEWIGGGK